jgi:ribosomal protein S18 acetylase RimI-like enzyme
MRHGSLEFRVVAEVPMLRFERTGTPDPSQLKAHCLAIIAEAQRRGVGRLLVDERGMDGWMAGGLDSLLVYREIVREAQAAGLTDAPLRIAVLTVPQASSDHDFLAQGAVGVGFDMAYFDDEDDALVWLGVRR